MTADNGHVTDIRRVAVSEAPIDAAALERLVDDARVGAIVTFSGNVRDHDHGRAVRSLFYEGHPSAQQVLEEVAAGIAADFDLIALAVEHRIGEIAIGESALVVCAASAHREQAFAACAAAVDRTKDALPVWKHQVFADGTDEWVNFA